MPEAIALVCEDVELPLLSEVVVEVAEVEMEVSESCADAVVTTPPEDAAGVSLDDPEVVLVSSLESCSPPDEGIVTVDSLTSSVDDDVADSESEGGADYLT